MNKYNTIFFGTPKVAIDPLKSLFDDDRFLLKNVVSQKAKPVGRKQILQDSDVSVFAKDKSIDVITPDSLKNVEFESWLKNKNLDIAVVVAYGKIIPKNILEIPKYGFINVHYSLLPKYRGASPVQSAIKNGDEKTGVTIMLMNEKMDEGDILYQFEEDVYFEDTYETLAERLSENTKKILPDIIERYINGKILPVSQDDSRATYSALIRKDMGEIDFENETAFEIFKKMKAFTPWPGVFTFFEGKRLKILEAKILNENVGSSFGEFVFDRGIQTRDGLLFPLRVQLEGRKVVDFGEFLRGVKREKIKFGQ